MADIYCATGKRVTAAVLKAGQLVFHATGDSRITYLAAALARVKQENFRGALIIAHHLPAGDGAESKTPDDFVTVDLASRQLVRFTGRGLRFFPRSRDPA